jgi:predicted nucleic acid-binding Zn ribbon protein
MPTYVYRFLDSDDTVEVHQAFTDDPLTEAVNPRDGQAHPVKKVFTPVGVTFKGGGFYKTDSRGSSSKSAPAESTTSSNGSSSGSGSGESTTATKPDAKPAAATPAATPSSTSSSAS